jgi:prepilin-type N-terminal cleavage/methylation domain-containing protein
MKSIHYTANDAGFSLIEVLVAIAIFSIGLMAVGMLQASSLMGSGDLARKTEALNFLEQQAGRLKTMTFYTDDPPVTPELQLAAGGYTAANHAINLPLAPMAPRFTVQWQVTDVVSNAEDPTGRITPQNGAQFAGVPGGVYTVAKQITIAVTPLGGVAPNDNIAEVQLLKTWAATYFK